MKKRAGKVMAMIIATSMLVIPTMGVMPVYADDEVGLKLMPVDLSEDLLCNMDEAIGDDAVENPEPRLLTVNEENATKDDNDTSNDDLILEGDYGFSADAGTPKHGYAYGKLSDSDKKLYDKFYDYSLDLRTYKADGKTFLWGNPVPIKIRDCISQEERDEIWKNSQENFYMDSLTEEQQRFICAFNEDHSEFTWITGPLFDFVHVDPDDPLRNHYHIELVMDTLREYIQSGIDTSQSPKRDLVTDINDMNRIVNGVLKGAAGCDTDYDRLKYVHDWLTHNNRYYYEFDEEIVTDNYTAANQSALSALLPDLSPVCAGYAEAFKVLCDGLGIPCVLVNGWVLSGDSWGLHEWNYVKLNGKWYAVDVTWDDPDKTTELVSGNETCKFFLVGQSTSIDGLMFKETHDPIEAGLLPELSDTAYDPANISNTAHPVTDGNLIPMPKLTEWDGYFSGDGPSCDLHVSSVKFNKNEISLSKGKKYNLKEHIEISPSTAIPSQEEWWSDNEAVATIDKGGIVKGISPGTANITITIDGHSATCKVIVPKPVSIKNAKVVLKKAKIGYNGNNWKPVVETIKGLTLKEDTDYTVTVKNSKGKVVKTHKAPGKYTLVIKGKGNYTGTTQVQYEILKGTNPLNVTAQKKTFNADYSKLKDKNQSISELEIYNFKKNGKGKITYTLSSAKKGKKSYKKYFTVNNKGKLTIKKGLKKASYTVKVKVTAAGNKNYKAGTKTVTFTVKIK